MNTENFDDAFRRKVESFHPPFRDDEIDRIQGYVSKQIPLSFWQRFGNILTFSVGTIIIISLLTSTIYQANENKNLLNKISDLNKKLEQKQELSAVYNAPKNIVITKTDTVFVVKHIKKPVLVIDGYEISSQNYDDKAEFADVKENNNLEKPLNLSKSENTGDSNSETSKKGKKTTKIPVSNQEVFLANESKNKAKTKKSTKLSDAANIEKVDILKFDDLSKSNIKLELQKSTFSNENNDLENTYQTETQITHFNIKQLSINNLKSKKYNSKDLNLTFDLSIRKSWMPQLIVKPKEKSSFKFPTIALPSLKYRVGLGTNLGYGQVGTSLLSDILFAKRWSITTGVNVSKLGFERFKDEDDFKRNKDQDFRDQYSVNIPIGNPIENIETHQILFKIPVYLNYRLPLLKDFTVLFSSGTDFDFHLQQFTSYSHFNFSRDDKQALQEKIPVTPFNNWQFSAGIEKRWNHFSLQFSPYFSTQIKKVSYLKEDFSFGFKLNGFYRLSK
jgi:hypothetical protein